VSIDIQVNANFLQNPKIVKLRRRLGSDGVLALLQLWCHARMDRPDGDLGLISNEDLEIVSGWNGENDVFADTLADLGLIDRHDDASTSIHDWNEHESFSMKSSKRVDAGKKGAITRWHGIANDSNAIESDSNAITQPIANDSNAIESDSNAITQPIANDSNAKKSDAPDQTRPDQARPDQNQTSNNTPPPPSPGGVRAVDDLQPEEQITPPGGTAPDDQGAASNASPRPEPRPGPPPPVPRADDPRAVRVFEHYQTVIAPAHAPSRRQAVANITGLLKRLRRETAYAEKSADEMMLYLLAVIDRYKKSAAFSRASDPFHRYACTNFFGRAEQWRSFAWDDSPAMKVTTPDPAQATKRLTPEEREAKLCASKNPGCLSGRERICEVCPNKQAKNKPRYDDWTGRGHARHDDHDDVAAFENILGDFEVIRG
jgi:hypothetical protein